ncbi:MAG: hypothetical protein MHM6MM_005250 [Cercozoa sp. M6MM]
MLTRIKCLVGRRMQSGGAPLQVTPAYMAGQALPRTRAGRGTLEHAASVRYALEQQSKVYERSRHGKAAQIYVAGVTASCLLVYAVWQNSAEWRSPENSQRRVRNIKKGLEKEKQAWLNWKALQDAKGNDIDNPGYLRYIWPSSKRQKRPDAQSTQAAQQQTPTAESTQSQT